MRRLIYICMLSLLWSLPKKYIAQDKGLDSLEHLLEIEQSPEKRIETLTSLAQRLQYQNPVKGKRFALEGYKLAQELEDSLNIAHTGAVLSTCYTMLGSLDTAESYRRESIFLFRKFGNARNVGIQYVNLASIFDSKGVPDSAIFYYEQALKQYQNGGNALDSAIVYNNLGILYEKRSNYPRAIEIYLQALRGFESAGRRDYVSFAYANIGNIYVRQKNYEEAQEYFRKSLVLKIENKDVYGEALIYNNLGSTFLQVGKPDSAIMYYNKSLVLKEEIGDVRATVTTKENLGNIYRLQQDFPEAKSILEQAYELGQKHGFKPELSQVCLQLGRLYLDLNKVGKAEAFLQEALQYNQQGKETENQLEIYKSLAVAYQKLGDLRGYEYYEKAIALEDSIRNDEQTREITRLEMQYAFDKEKEVLVLEKEKSELALTGELNRQRFQRNMGLGALGSGLIILMLLWRGYRSKQKNNHLLTRQNDELEQALEDRENLLKEIHHRVKNNLQVVSSLLSIQSRNIQDPAARLAINEGKDRVKAMGLIHQNLYQEENLIGVDLPQYLEKLGQGLLNSYHIEEKDIQIVQEIEPVKMDVDTLIPLGLILNELISNSLKYAFEGKERGNIRLELARKAEGLSVEVADDGVGLPKDFEVEKSNSMGYKLIRAFVKKMNARLEIKSENGTQVSILLPDLKY